MVVQTITYGDKSYINQNVDIPEANKVQDTDMNEIKSVVNNNATILSGETNYSTTEVNTGKIWIDGKEIYRKVVNIGSLPNNAIKNIAHNISNLNEVIKLYGIWENGSGFYFNLPFVTNLSTQSIKIYADDSNIYVEDYDSYSYATGFVVIEYTKTS